MPSTQHTAQLVCRSDSHVQSDIFENIDLQKAKSDAKANYQTKYYQNKNWQAHWKTFNDLLEDSFYKTS